MITWEIVLYADDRGWWRPNLILPDERHAEMTREYLLDHFIIPMVIMPTEDLDAGQMPTLPVQGPKW